MFLSKMRPTVSVNVKLFAGIDKDANVAGYDHNAGLVLTVPEGARLKKVVKMIGLPKRYTLVFFINGQRVGLQQKLEDGDEIACLRPIAGG
jgi:sulfur carrier protein ThiS